jgi:hypothetical protein
VSFDAQHFNELAHWITDQRDDEASLRTAINRVYYAAHLLAREKLISRGELVPKGTGDDHWQVIKTLRPGKTRGLADMLDELRRLRQHADYHLNPDETAANEGCRHCKKVREASGSFPLVNQTHWNDAQNTGKRVFPLINML